MITCTSCGTENPERARFCIECGSSLAAVCLTCGEPILAGARFCANCGSALAATIAASRTAPAAVAERRVCSILFCDLVGITPISEARDPEAVRELLSRYFETARLVIGRYGGTVEKFIGDAVMAVWGAPVATEDDAERAVRAALELIDAVDALGGPVGVPGLAARAGVVTGEVAVTLGAVGQGMVAGDPVNTAARIQSAAAVAEVLVDDTTARLVRAAIDVEDAGDRALKGKAQHEHLWRAARVLANVGGVQRIDGLEAPLIGRDLELRLLKDLFHTTVSRSASRMALVTGEAGSGKSRLGWEFEKYVDGLSDAVWWHRSRCLAYGDGVSFWALTEMVRQRLGVAEDEPPDVVLPLLIEGLDRFIPDPAERVFIGVRLGRLLGVRHPDDDDRDLDQSELFAGWRAWLVRLADTAPVVWVIEDLQHADSGLLDFIDHVLDWTRTAPIHLVGLTRPELDEVRMGWATGRHRHPIALEPLDEASMSRLLDALVPAMPAGAVAAIAEQAHGVPLFAVETVRSLIDDELVVPVDGRYRLVGDVGTLSVPETLRGVLTSRLDHLAAADRDLLATAGVLGTTFSAESLASVADRRIEDVLAALAELVARDLITVGADPLSPQRGSYSFTHDLLRRVAVDTLSRRDLRARHLRVADHLRSAFPDDGEEVADTIAQHLLAAVDAVPDHVDAARHRAEAVVELVRSGQRASRLGAPRRAGLAWEAAAAHTPDDAAAAELLVQAAHQLGLAGDVTASMRCAEQARSLFDVVDDRHGAARASVQLGSELVDLQHYREARSILEPAVDLLRATPDVDALTGLRILCMISTFTASDDARDLATEAIRLAERVMPPPAELAKVFGTLGVMHSFAGERLRALAAYRESVRLAESVERWGDAASALSNMAAEQVDFDPAAALLTATRALDHARRAGFRIFLEAAAENLGQALISLGRWDEAAALLDEIDRVEGLGDASIFVSVVGRLRGLRGDRAGAARCVDALGAVASEDAELHCYAAAISMFAMLGSVSARDELEAARAVLEFRDELGINFSSVREAWVVAARAADRLGSDETGDLLAMLDAHLPTELSPMLRAERLVVEARTAVDREQAFATAIAAERTDSSPHLLAQGLLDWAEHRIRAGRPDDAALLIDEAAEIAERLGSASISRRAQEVRSSATTVPGPV